MKFFLSKERQCHRHTVNYYHTVINTFLSHLNSLYSAFFIAVAHGQIVSILINFTSKVFMLVQIRDIYQFRYCSVNDFYISCSHMIKFSCIQTRPFYMGYNMRTEQPQLNNRLHNIDIILGW